MSWPIFERSFTISDPWRELRQLQHEMERLFSRYEPERSLTASFPAVNIWRKEDNIVVSAEIAGIEPKDLDISIHQDQLILRGKRGERSCAEGEVYHRRERGCGDFIKTITLPHVVDPDKVEAEYHNGVLTITLPRAEQDKPKKVTIKTAQIAA